RDRVGRDAERRREPRAHLMRLGERKRTAARADAQKGRAGCHQETSRCAKRLSDGLYAAGSGDESGSHSTTLPPVGGEGRTRSRSERGRGGGATLAPYSWLPPTPDPSPPLATLAGGGEPTRRFVEQ